MHRWPMYLVPWITRYLTRRRWHKVFGVRKRVRVVAVCLVHIGVRARLVTITSKHTRVAHELYNPKAVSIARFSADKRLYPATILKRSL